MGDSEPTERTTNGVVQADPSSKLPVNVTLLSMLMRYVSPCKKGCFGDFQFCMGKGSCWHGDTISLALIMMEKD